MAGPPEKSELPLTDIAMAVALVLVLAIAYTSLAPLLSGAPKSNAPVDTRAGARLAHRLRLHLSAALLDASPPHPPLTPPTPHPDHIASPRSCRPIAMAARRGLAQEEEVACCQADLSRHWPRFARCELPR